jgi:hypothetical protein
MGNRDASKDVTDRTRLLYDKAHKYRIHQDSLRWSLAAGYAGSFAAGLAVLIKMRADNNDHWLVVIVSMLLFAFGFVYFFVLAVENWYYNLFAKYANECDRMLGQDDNIPTLSEFTACKRNREKISPRHPSFQFVLLLAALGSSIYLGQAVYDLVNLVWRAPFLYAAPLISCLLAALWLVLCWQSTTRVTWNRCVYPCFIERLQNLYDPKEDESGECAEDS